MNKLWPFHLPVSDELRSESLISVVLLSAIAGTAIVLGRQIAYGPGLGGDSIVYISVARSLIEGSGFEWYIAGSPYTVYPPGYPLLLALASLFVFDPFNIAGPLNALLYGLNVFVAGLWIKKNVNSRFLVIWGCLATALSLPLTGLATTVLSETPFILFVTLSLLQIEKHIKTECYHALMWSAVFAGIAFSMRYAGAALVISILLLLILQRNAALPKKGKAVIGFGLISTIPIASWFARNLYLTGKFSGHASPNRDFLEIANGVFSVLAEWVIPLARVGYPLRGGGGGGRKHSSSCDRIRSNYSSDVDNSCRFLVGLPAKI